MKIYNYNNETREFSTESLATENPLEKGKFLIPANATIGEPLSFKEGFAVCFEADKWIYVEDNRGKAFNIRKEVNIDYLGTLKDGITKEEILFTEAEDLASMQSEFRATRDALLSKVDVEINIAFDMGLPTLELSTYRQALRDSTKLWVMPEPKGDTI